MTQAALIVAILLAGCVPSGPITGICAVMPIGQYENGAITVRYRCEPETTKGE